MTKPVVTVPSTMLVRYAARHVVSLDNATRSRMSSQKLHQLIKPCSAKQSAGFFLKCSDWDQRVHMLWPNASIVVH